LKRYKSPGSEQIPAELVLGGGKILLSAIHKLINSVWIKEELRDEWKEPVFVPIHKKDKKTDCNYYRGMTLLSTSYKILSNILLSRLSDKIFCIRKMLEKRWEYSETVHQYS
jgi:hypothetical protein